MASELRFRVSWVPFDSPRFPANHGPNADPLHAPSVDTLYRGQT
jgi:hypothetical protein